MRPLIQKYFNFIKRFIPENREAVSVGIDIGISTCKMVELKKTADSFSILSWAIVPIKNDDYKSSIESALTNLKNPVKSVSTSVYGKGTLIRYVDMPRMSIEDLRNSFAIEADKYFPFAQDQIYTDCFILDPKGQSKQMKVLAAATKKELADKRVSLMNSLNLNLTTISLNPLALANVINVLGFKLKDTTKPQALAILDMGETVSNLIIMVDRLPWFTRDIYFGGRDLSKRISSALMISMEEAEKLKCNLKERENEILDICESAISQLVQELKLSFDYFTTENAFELKNLILVGGASFTSGFYKLLEKNLDVKIESWNPFENMSLGEGVSKDEIDKQSNRLTVAFGLALY